MKCAPVIFIILLLAQEAVTVTNAISGKQKRLMRSEVHRHNVVINKVNKEIGEAQLLKRMHMQDAADRMKEETIMAPKAKQVAANTQAEVRAGESAKNDFSEAQETPDPTKVEHKHPEHATIGGAAPDSDDLNLKKHDKLVVGADGSIFDDLDDEEAVTDSSTNEKETVSKDVTEAEAAEVEANIKAEVRVGGSAKNDLSDAQELQCKKPQCAKTNKPWTQKCTWRACKGCKQCLAAANKKATTTAAANKKAAANRKAKAAANRKAKAAANRKAPAPKPVTQKTEIIKFGGQAHKNSKSAITRINRQEHNMFYRPEQIHSEQCVSGECTGCSDSALCWRGTGSNAFNVSVPGGTDNTETLRTAGIWIQCGSNTAEWHIYSWGPTNCQVWALLDGHKTALQAHYTYHIKVPNDGQNHKLVVVHSVTNMKEMSSAEVQISAYGVNVWVDKCMTKKLCMGKLGDGTDSAFNIRNNIVRQKNCLNGNAATEDESECNAWTGCLKDGDTTQDNYMLTLKNLVNAMAKHGSLAELEGRHATGKPDAECMDPSAADPESLECECWEAIQSKCGEADEQEACFQKHFCEQRKVSCTWKEENCVDQKDKQQCCTASLMQASMKTPNASIASMMMTKSKGGATHDKVAESLDSTLSGKCYV